MITGDEIQMTTGDEIETIETTMGDETIAGAHRRARLGPEPILPRPNSTSHPLPMPAPWLCRGSARRR